METGAWERIERKGKAVGPRFGGDVEKVWGLGHVVEGVFFFFPFTLLIFYEWPTTIGENVIV